jgi:hypothetical protein
MWKNSFGMQHQVFEKGIPIWMMGIYLVDCEDYTDRGFPKKKSKNCSSSFMLVKSIVARPQQCTLELRWKRIGRVWFFLSSPSHEDVSQHHVNRENKPPHSARLEPMWISVFHIAREMASFFIEIGYANRTARMACHPVTTDGPHRIAHPSGMFLHWNEHFPQQEARLNKWYFSLSPIFSWAVWKFSGPHSEFHVVVYYQTCVWL